MPERSQVSATLRQNRANLNKSVVHFTWLLTGLDDSGLLPALVAHSDKSYNLAPTNIFYQKGLIGSKATVVPVRQV